MSLRRTISFPRIEDYLFVSKDLIRPITEKVIASGARIACRRCGSGSVESYQATSSSSGSRANVKHRVRVRLTADECQNVKIVNSYELKVP